MHIKALHQLFLSCNSVCTDTRKLQQNDMFFALKGDNFNGNLFAEKAIKQGAKYAIIDDEKFANISNTILVNDVLEILQELASFHRIYLNIPIIALTGSNGKTTTKELINAVLSQKYNTTATLGNLNNHIGVPLTLLSMTKTTEIGIVEMGANHLKEIDFLCRIAQPDFGYITNFGKAHLEGFGSIEGVIKGKSELYNYLITNNKTIFINSEDSIQVEKTQTAKTYSFGSSNTKSAVTAELIEANPNVKISYEEFEIQSNLIGNYNFSNISTAIAIGQYFKVSPNSIKKAIEAYVPDNNRSQIIKKESNTIILDAYNANPTSMKAALENFSKLEAKKKIAILGDMFELGKDAKIEHQEIVNQISNLSIDKAVLIGKHFSTVKSNYGAILIYSSYEAFKNDFNFSEIKDTSILIKGSRGMALERALDLI